MENFKGTTITSLINLADLPKELQFEIMLYLDDPAIISNLTLINKNFHNLLQNQELWQLLLKDLFFKLSNRFGMYSVQTDWKLFNNYVLNSKTTNRNFCNWFTLLYDLHPINILQKYEIESTEGKDILIKTNRILAEVLSSLTLNNETLKGIFLCQLAIINFLLSQHNDLSDLRYHYLGSIKKYCLKAIKLDVLAARYLLMLIPQHQFTKEEIIQLKLYVKEILIMALEAVKTRKPAHKAIDNFLEKQPSIIKIISEAWQVSFAISFNDTLHCYKELFSIIYNEAEDDIKFDITLNTLNKLSFEQIEYLIQSPLQNYLLNEFDTNCIDEILNFSLLRILTENSEWQSQEDIILYVNFYKDNNLDHPTNWAVAELLYYNSYNLANKLSANKFRKLANFLFKDSRWIFHDRFTLSEFDSFLNELIDNTLSSKSQDNIAIIAKFIDLYPNEVFVNRFFCKLLVINKIPILEKNWLPFIELLWHFKDFYHHIINSEFLHAFVSDYKGITFLYQLKNIKLYDNKHFSKIHILFRLLANAPIQARKLFDKKMINWNYLLELEPRKCEFILRFAAYITDLNPVSLESLLVQSDSLLEIVNQSDWIPSKMLTCLQMKFLFEELRNRYRNETYDHTNLLEEISHEIFNSDVANNNNVIAYQQYGLLGTRLSLTLSDEDKNKRRKLNDGTVLTIADIDKTDEKTSEKQPSNSP